MIVNAHREGCILEETIKSVVLACSELNKFQIKFEVIIVVDEGDSRTINVAESFTSFRVVKVWNQDLGKSRNAGVTASNLKYIAFVDGDDLVSSNWLLDCFRLAETEAAKSIYHPEINYFFGDKGTSLRRVLFGHFSSSSPTFSKWTLVDQNPWTALCFAHRSVFEEIPYRESSELEGTGFEDWSFNLETLARDFQHIAVPNTVHFLRQKKTSMKKNMAARNSRVFSLSSIKEF